MSGSEFDAEKQQGQNGGVGQVVQNAGQQVAQKGKEKAQNGLKKWLRKKLGKEQVAKEAAKHAGKFALSGSLAYVLFWVVVVIVALILLIGIIMFFVSMPGMVMDKIKGFFREAGKLAAAFFGADTTSQIDNEEFLSTLDYIEDMGWDLKGEGILTKHIEVTELEDYVDKFDLEEDKVYVDEEVGVIRDADTDDIVAAEADFVFTYMISDNYVYTIKNFNLATQEHSKNFIDKILNGIATAVYKIYNAVYGPLYDLLGVTDGVMETWGKGMLMFYYDDGLGYKQKAVNTETIWNWDSIEVDVDAKKLYIKKSSIFNNNNPMEFSLDGWTGRYGMPLEFLLAVHKATYMPDLAYDMATHFNTVVNIYLHDVKGNVEIAYRNDAGEYIPYSKIDDAIHLLEDNANWFNALINWFDDLVDGEEEAIAMHDLGIEINPDCDGTCETETVYYTTDGTILKQVVDEDGVASYYYLVDDKEGGEIDTTRGKKVSDDEDSECTGEYTGTVETKTVLKNVCDACQEYAGLMIDVMSASFDPNFKAYQPYIANVTGHWYRDVYFIEPEDSNTTFVDYDYDYEAIMKERWTLYETYTADESDGYKYDPDRAGMFILYEIDEDGEYMYNDDGTPVLYKQLTWEEKKEEEKKKAQLEAEGKGDEYVSPDDATTVKYAKKAETLKFSDREALEDLGWNDDAGLWTAYEENSGKQETGYDLVYTVEHQDKLKEIVGERNMERGQKIASRVFMNVITSNNINQVGEGQRAETNPDIKKMFLHNNYFRYDGSTERAEIINKLRDKVYEERTGSSKKKYGPLTDEELEKTFTLTIGRDETEKTDEFKVSDYIGSTKDALQQDALNGFSILENTHTLDADYIYRDFKELMVELDYFEKEELEEDFTPQLLQFPIPDIGSAGYPDRSIDKRENEIGTMIHSKYDIETNTEHMMQKLRETVGSELPEGADEELLQENAAETPQTGANAGVEIDAAGADTTGTGVTMTGGNTNVQLDEVKGIADIKPGKRKASQVSLKEFLETTREMCEEINKVGYDYCVYVTPIGSAVGDNQEADCATCTSTCINSWTTEYQCLRIQDGGGCSCETNHCKHNVHQNDCYLARNYEESKTTQTNLCCATLVSWALQNVGVMPEETPIHGAENLAWYCKNTLGFEEIQKDEPLQEGDILCYEGHVDICGEKEGSGFVKYNGGHQIDANSVEFTGTSCIEKIDGWPGKATYALRPNWGRSEPAEYEGYEGNEAVVSPVTGVLLKYGTITENYEEERQNIDLMYGPTVTINVSEDEEENEDGVTPNAGETPNAGAPAANVVVDNKDGEGSGNNPEGKDEEEKEKLPPEEVGYAVIKVLDYEDFEVLESKVTNKWSNINGSQGLLDDHNIFYKDLVLNEDDYEDLTKDDDITDETIYGFKEFLQTYEDGKINGYTICIEGFKCELPDEDFTDKNQDGSVADEEDKPDGEDLTLDSFKIAANKINQENKLIKTLYELPEQYKLASKKATDRLNTEELIKGDAAPVIMAGDIIFIKEGTVIGRTYTDREVVEDLRENEKIEDYKISYYQDEPKLDEDGNEIFEDKLVGNYVRVTMMDKESKTPVEDVEAYMKLDEILPQPELDYEFFFWAPYEGGPWGTYQEYYDGYDESKNAKGNRDDVGAGPTIIAVDNDLAWGNVSWSIAIGIAQWTNNSNGLNNLAGLCTYLSEYDPALAALADFAGKSAEFYNVNLASLKQTWWDICSNEAGYNTMLKAQMEYCYNEEWLERDSYTDIVAWAKDREMALQGTIFSVMNWGNYSYNGGHLLDNVDENKTDIENVNMIMEACAGYGASLSTPLVARWDSEAQLAVDIINGKIDEEQLREWIETKKIEGVSPGYGEGVEYTFPVSTMEKFTTLFDKVAWIDVRSKEYYE